MPAGFEPAISSLRGWRPDQLDDGTIYWRCGPDSNRRTNSFADCPLKPLGYRIIIGWGSWIRTNDTGVKVRCLAAWLYPNIGDPRRVRTGRCRRERAVSYPARRAGHRQGTLSLQIRLRDNPQLECRQYRPAAVQRVQSGCLPSGVLLQTAICKWPAEN